MTDPQRPPTQSTHASTERPLAVVLLSGGLDSATVAAIAQRDGFDLHAITFDYGQRHRYELEAAARVAASLGIENHRVVNIDLRAFGGSALTSEIDVPKDRTDDELADGIPVTYVPARNTIFLSYALGLAEVVGATAIYIGVNAVDYSGYPDCRPEFIEAFEKMANLATRVGVESGPGRWVKTPLIDLKKTEIIRQGLSLSVDYSLTHSCYDPQNRGRACGRCDACHIRNRAFRDMGLEDPATFSSKKG